MSVWDAFRSDGRPAPVAGCWHEFDLLRTGVRAFGGWVVEARCIHCRTKATTPEQKAEAADWSRRRENERLKAAGL